MADKSQKTEKPTARKLAKAKEEGQVPFSQEMANGLCLCALLAAAAMLGPGLTKRFMIDIRQSMCCQTSMFADSGTLMNFMHTQLINYTILTIPFFLFLMVAGTSSSIICGGLTWSKKAIKPKMKGLNPFKGFKSLFGKNNLVKLVMSIIKLAFIGLLVYFYLKNRVEEIAGIRWAWNNEILSAICDFVFGVCLRICIGLIVIGAADFIYQKWKYKKDLMMSKQEIKEEHRSQEGAPEVKRKIRQLQFNMTVKRMMKDVPKADVVLVNPTHFAVALKYDSNKMGAPIVVAKGADNICTKIKDIARAYGVPIVQKPQLARTIYYTVDIDRPIPENMFVAVAEVLAMVYRLRHSRR